MRLSTEIEFLTHLINLDNRLKDGYKLSITRHWDDKYVIAVLDMSKCDPVCYDDPVVIQQTSDFAFLSMYSGVSNEVGRLYVRLKKHNLLKNC